MWCEAVKDGKKTEVEVDDLDTRATCEQLTPGTWYNVTIETNKMGFSMEHCEDACSVHAVTGKTSNF